MSLFKAIKYAVIIFVVIAATVAAQTLVKHLGGPVWSFAFNSGAFVSLLAWIIYRYSQNATK